MRANRWKESGLLDYVCFKHHFYTNNYDTNDSEKLFDKIRVELDKGRRVAEVGDYFGISDETVRRVRRSLYAKEV